MIEHCKRFYSCLLFLVTFALFLVNPIYSYADRVEFGKGNVLFGTVQGLAGGVLEFKNGFADSVKIPVEKIKFIETQKPVKIKLNDGSILTGNLVMLKDGQFGILLATIKEKVSLNWKNVKTINEPPGKWTGFIASGGTLQSGNTSQFTFNVSAEAKREWERDRFSFRFLYNYGEQNGAMTARNTFGSMKFDHFFTKVIYSVLSVELLRDDFQDLNLRAIVGAGLGYQIWKQAANLAEIELGITYFSEDRKVGMDDRFISGRVAVNLAYQIFTQLLFTNYFLYYPNFESPKEYRLRNEASLISQFAENWSFKFTHIFQQNSQPAPGIKDKDHTWIFAVQYGF